MPEPAFETAIGFFGSVRLRDFECPQWQARIRGRTLEIGAFIPERAGDDVHFAVVIEVAEVCAFAPELVGELDFLEGVDFFQRAIANAIAAERISAEEIFSQ